MTRNDFKGMLNNSKHPSKKQERNPQRSMTDPTFYQTGRDIIANPLPVTYKGAYTRGVTSANMQSFDVAYPDKIDVFNDALRINNETQTKLKELKKQKDNETKQKSPDTTQA